MTEKEFIKLLDKFLTGTTTPEEEKLLSEFEDYSLSDQKDKIFNSDLERLQLKNEIYSRIKRNIHKKRRAWIGIAASALMLMGLGALLLVNSYNDPEIFLASNMTDSSKRISLKDGSVVILNKGSEIKYDNDHDGTRYAVLEGEAFFEIARNEQKPFIVKTAMVKTKVLGTSFNISESDSEVNVTVATGLVEVFDKNSSVKLKPNQRTSYRIGSKSFKTSHIDHKLFTFWYKNSIKLDGVSMNELAEFITYKYGLEVNFVDEEARNTRMTVILRPEDEIQTVLTNINYINELKITKTKNNMIEVASN